jgi:hypothetical protein
MALSDRDIVITPNKDLPDDPKIEFSGANASVSAQTITLRVYPDNAGTLSFEGSAGQLFSITNDLTGILFSVNDGSGIPVLEVNANADVTFTEFGGNVGVGTGFPITDFHVQGETVITGRVGIGTANVRTLNSNIFSVYGTAMIYGNIDIANPAGGTSGIYFNDGSYQTTAFTGAATPSFGTAGTIQYAGAGNTFAGNSDNFFWDTANNRLGIGTNSPTNVLTVVSTTTPAWFNTINSAVGTNNYEILVGNSTSTGTTVGYVNNTTVPYGYLSAGTTTRNITIAANGRVGIGGVTAPRVLLDVGGGAVIGASWAGNSNFINPPANGVAVQGSVGIGTYTPLAALDVRGGVGVTAASNFGGAVTVASLASNGAVSGTTGTFTGALYGANFNTAGTATVNALVSNGAVSGTTGTFSGDLSIADKIVHTGDTNTAIRFPTNDTVTIETNGIERFRVDLNGNIGIGSSSPAAKLDIITSEDRGLRVSGSLSDTVYFTAFHGGISNNLRDIGLRGANIRFETGATTGTTSTEHMRIDSNGNVGIGTATVSAGYRLQVQGSIKSTGTIDADVQFLGQPSDTAGAPSFSWTGDTNVGMYRPTTDTIGFTTAGTERMRINATGSVGIATTAPGSTLDVNGVASIRSAMSVAGTATVNALVSNGAISGTAGTFTSDLYSANFNTAGTATVNALVSNTSVKTATVNASSTIVGQNIYSNGFVQASGTIEGNAIDSNTTITAGTGLTVVAGGVNVSGFSQFTGNVSIAGNLNVTGTISTQNANVLVVQDPIIYLGEGNTGNNWDLGIVGNYNDGIYEHTGFVRNHVTGVWTLFDTLPTEPNVNTGNVDWANSSLTFAAFLVGNVNVAGQTASISTTTGAIRVPGTGGVGIGGRLNVGGAAWFADTLTAGGAFRAQSINSNTNVVGTNVQSTSQATVASLVSNGAVSGTTGTFTGALYGASFNTAGTATVAALVSNGAISGTNATFNGNITVSNGSTNKRGLLGTAGDNDFWFFGGGATASNAGFLEIATGDDGAEPIFVRQYNGSPQGGTVARTLTLLDASGNSEIPGNLTIPDQIIHAGDTNTLIRFPANDTVSIETNGSERFRIDSNGNVGIATATVSTGYKLQVQGSIKSTGTIDADVQFLGQASDTATAPSFSWTGDTDVGMYRPATDTIGFTTAGTERMRIDSNGNVAIGATTPTAKLNVSYTPGAAIPALGAAASDMSIGAVASYGMMFGTRSDGLGYIQQQRFDSTATAYDLILQPNGGRVGIATTVPLGVIDTGGSTASNIQAVFTRSPSDTNFQLIARNGTTGTASGTEVSRFGLRYGSGDVWNTGIRFFRGGGSTDGFLAIDTGGSERVRVDANGRVGIATTVPGSTLDVNGIASIRSAMSVAGTATVNALASNGAISGTTGTFSGDLSIADKIIHTGDTNTAIRFPANDTFTVETNGVERFRVDASGNVGIGTTTIQTGYMLQVEGGFAAINKSFVINHPTKSGYKLQYASLEGPENGVYVRGRLKGESRIELPDYWLGLIDDSTITVNLTAIGHVQNLYVSDIDQNTVWIGADSDADIHCFYTVYAERKDIDKLTVEYKDS